ncbi:SAV_2336 N-terminal domain-related protein [Streptomyces nojiriensis]|uniref:SAV_2336 N-terminal domain-related protein n=1 Tax=Streptomyces nojiriensis TaxID=66374 RepID=UPI0036DDED95
MDAPSRPDGPPRQRRALREALAGLLAQQPDGPQPQDLADVLWISRLAGLAPVSSDRPGPDSGAPRPRGADGATHPSGTHPALPAEPPPTPGATPGQDRLGERREPRVRLHALAGRSPGAPDHGPAHVVQVARPPALPGVLALSRALRPLRQWAGSNGPPRLDEEATAQATGEAGHLLPVWAPAMAPRFSVDLVVDTGATMAVWRELASELYTALECHGAFADVRCWALDTSLAVPRLTPFRRRSPTDSSGLVPSVPWHRPLAGASGRRILLVLTDGVGPAWYGSELPDMLARASRVRPTAALQVLPRRLWHRTALHTAQVEARAADPRLSHVAFRSEAALPGIARGARGARERAAVRWLPVMEVDGSWLVPWAKLAAGRTSGWVPMLAAPVHGVRRPLPPPRPEGGAGAAADRVARFRSGASPDAYRLACHLAAAPLSLPVMRLVQRATVPRSGQTDLAEIFLSGLIERRGGPTKSADPDDLVYDFASGVREELLAELTRGESLRVLDHVLAKVSGRVAATFGGTLDFRALAAMVGENPATATGRALPERSLPFAEVAVAVLRGAGGQHQLLAGRLEEAAAGSRRTTTVRTPAPDRAHVRGVRTELLTEVRPVLSPPDSPYMVGRKSELATLTHAVLASLSTPGAPESPHPGEPALVVIGGTPGMGRNRLVQEYVRLHGERHSFIHWINARRRDSLREGLLKLWHALAPSGSRVGVLPPLDRLWSELAARRDWLIVLDGVRSWPREHRTGNAGDGGVLPYGFPPAGRGCVLATTDVFHWNHPRATAIVLGALTPQDHREFLQSALGEAFDPADARQRDELERMVGMMPRIPDRLSWGDVLAGLSRLGPPSAGTSEDSAVPPAQPAAVVEAVLERAFGVPGGVVAMTSLEGPDGRALLATYGLDRQVRLWDPDRGVPVGEPFTLDAAGVVALAAIPDGRGRTLLATIDSSGTVRRWNATDGSPAGSPFKADPGRVLTMTAFHGSDGRALLAVADYSGMVRLWDPEQGEPLGVHLDMHTFPGRAMTSIRGPRGRPSMLLTADYSGVVRLWDGRSTAAAGPPLLVRPAEVVAMTVLPGADGSGVLATVGYDRIVRLWELPLPSEDDGDLWDRLDAMPGLDGVKAHLARLHPVSLHLVFAGSRGTGKTTVARLVGEIYRDLGVLSRSQVVALPARDLVAEYVGGSAQRVHRAVHQALGGVLLIDEADTLDDEAVDTLLTRMELDRGRLAVILTGYPSRMRELLEARPGLARRFGHDNLVEFPDCEPEVLHEIVLRRMRQSGLRWGPEVTRQLGEITAGMYASRDESFGNAHAMDALAKGVLRSWAQRTGTDLGPVLPEDVPERYREYLDRPVPGPDALLDAMEALDGLVGLDSVRETLTGLALRLRLRRGRDAVPPHLLFVGPPGTGKTTVARMAGELFRSLGLLRRGHVVVVTPADLVASYVGQTAPRTREVVRRALDGVLVIDEAYGLGRDPSGHFGQEALGTLVLEMERWRGRLVVVASGYPEEMEHFLAANAGLRSRFTETVCFPEYTVPELVEILRRAAAAEGYTLPPAAEERAGRWLTAKRDAAPAEFGNAREAHVLLAAMETRMAVRTQSQHAGPDAIDGVFIREDVPDPLDLPPRAEGPERFD